MIAVEVITGLIGLGSKFIEDKDKRAEFIDKQADRAHELMLKMLDAKTYPWVDALVKLAYASEAIAKGLLRPIGAAGLTGFVLYAEIKGIELSPTVEALCAAAFPGWMASRHQEKKRKQRLTDESDIGW